MEHTEFKKLLLDSAVCTMSCDGELHEHEYREIQTIVKESVYFRDMDVAEELNEMFENVRNNGEQVVKGFLNKLSAEDLTPTQELLLLEVISRIISADDKSDQAELHFIKNVRSKLKVTDEIILMRFNKFPYLELRTTSGHDEKSFIGRYEKTALNFDTSVNLIEESADVSHTIDDTGNSKKTEDSNDKLDG